MSELVRFFRIYTYFFLIVNAIIILYGLVNSESPSSFKFGFLLFILINTLHSFSFIFRNRVALGYAAWDFSGAAKDYIVLFIVGVFWLVVTVMIFYEFIGWG